MPPLESTPLEEGLTFQNELLPKVSRTFALTIPRLPEPLDTVVGNAYLWCRIADTVEDDPHIQADDKQRLLNALIQVLSLEADAGAWACDAHRFLSEETSIDERNLLAGAAKVMAVTATFNATQIAAIRDCVTKMCQGMSSFEMTTSTQVQGLPTIGDLDSYCYYVAGVVGEMLTALFCDYSPQIDEHREEMLQLATSFGQGLQMTNILKDVWEDLDEGRCWLPRDTFLRANYDLDQLDPDVDRENFNKAMHELIAVAHAHLRNALDYALFIPKHEAGIRRFCLWSIGMAVLTLQRIERHPRFRSAADVKLSRPAVGAVIAATNLFIRHNLPMRLMFTFAAHHLPYKPVYVGSEAEFSHAGLS